MFAEKILKQGFDNLLVITIVEFPAGFALNPGLQSTNCQKSGGSHTHGNNAILWRFGPEIAGFLRSASLHSVDKPN